MNLVNCSADCFYQKDGQCKLGSRATLSPTVCNNCNYYVKRKPPGPQPPKPPMILR